MKHEAISLDTKSAALANENVPLRTTLGATDEKTLLSTGQKMVDTQEWTENTVANLNSSAKERMRTRKLAQTSVVTLKESAQTLRAQAHVVDAALKDSLKSISEEREAIAAQIRAKDKEIRNANMALSELELAIKHRSPTLQVAIGRQEQRNQRPGIELCHDKAQQALNAELNLLKDSISKLSIHLDKSKETRTKLLHDKERLLARQEVCEHNAKIDNELLRKIRFFYPQEIQLSGYLLVDKRLDD